MSTVLVRNRNLSSYQFFTDAVSIRRDVIVLVTGTAIPKSWRFVFSVPMAETARSVVHNLVTANAFYPNTEHGVEMRKHHMTLAIADLEQLLQDVQCLAGLGVVKLSRCERLAREIDRDIKLIKGARKGVRLIGKG